MKPTQRQYELALGQWESWKAYALELQAKLVKYEGGSPMVLNAATTPPAQAVLQEPCAVVKWQTGGPVVHIIGEVQVGDLLYRAAPTPPAQQDAREEPK